jgi:hypothetical protein
MVGTIEKCTDTRRKIKQDTLEIGFLNENALICIKLRLNVENEIVYRLETCNAKERNGQEIVISRTIHLDSTVVYLLELDLLSCRQVGTIIEKGKNGNGRSGNGWQGNVNMSGIGGLGGSLEMQM